MSDETKDTEETNELEAKPTITIAEKQGGTATTTSDAQPTITIAEKDGGN